MRKGIPIGLTATTYSLGEMRTLKEAEHSTSSCLHTLNAIHVVDRDYVCSEFWDYYKFKYQSTVITRLIIESDLCGIKRKTHCQGSL